jgi:histidyl-tRNA synthetase
MWLGEDEVKNGIVKVKSLAKKEEYIIKDEELQERVV